MSGQGKSSHESSSVFNELRLEGDFCDAVIQVQDVQFPIHKVILCKSSLFFQALFKRWSNPDQKIFDIPGLTPDMMQLIIEFAYTGSVSVREDNLQDLLFAADRLHVMDVVQTCSHFLGEQLSPKNCIGIWHLTKVCYSPELQRKAYHYITDHFERVVFYEEFQLLSVQELSEILERDDLNVRKENSVFDAILHWIAHKPEERQEHIAGLLPKVRLALTSVNYLRINVISNKLVENNPECLQVVSDALHTLCQMVINNSVTGLCNPLARPRLPNAILLAIGGWSGDDPTNGIEAYDIRTDRWINVTNNVEHHRAYHGTAFLSGHVYCVGGFDTVKYLNSVCKFDPSTLTWHEVAPMYCRRSYVSVTVLDGCIYAMGGFDGSSRLSTVERYRPETNQWSFIAPMHEQRSDASSTTLHNKVYICGGFNRTECLQTCEYYSPETNQWTMITPMTHRRSGIGLIAYANRVYAVGGFDGTTRLRSAEAYNPRTHTWHAVSSMATSRSNFGIAVIDDRLFVVGGFNGRTTSSNVEFYNATTNKWSKACRMEIVRSGLGCCVLYGIPNLVKYTVPRDSLPLLCLDDESVEAGDTI